jgi:hypothetical protein
MTRVATWRTRCSSQIADISRWPAAVTARRSTAVRAEPGSRLPSRMRMQVLLRSSRSTNSSAVLYGRELHVTRRRAG